MSKYAVRLAAFLLAVACAAPVSASTISLVTSRLLLPSDQVIDWSQLGGDFTPVAPGTTATSTLGTIATITGASAFTVFNGSTYNADFLPGDLVLSLFDGLAGNPTTGVIRLQFNHAVSGVGAQIQAFSFGSFTANVTALNSSGNPFGPLLSINGFVNGNGDGSAPFLGLKSDALDVYGVEFQLGDGFAINSVSLTAAAAVPEPATMTLLVLGGGLMYSRRRFGK
jgi:hypothetical protein